MANEYRTWYADDEQEYITQCAEFLEHLVGWYRAYVKSDTGTDRWYVWVSEGESNDKRPPRLIALRGASNVIELDGLLVASDGFDFTTGAYNTHVGTSADLTFPATTPGRCRTVANKDRVFFHLEQSASVRYAGYLGFVDSFYSPTDDPNPVLVRGQNQSTNDWTDASEARMLRYDRTEQVYSFNWDTALVNEGYPNPRNGKFTFRRPTLYYDTDVQYSEVRGAPKGLYLGREDRLAHGSLAGIGGELYLCTKLGSNQEAILVGPVSTDGTVPTNYGWMPRPNLETDYSKRGLQLDVAVSGTLALWRFDTGHLDGYAYGSGSALPVPTIYTDTAGNYDLTPQNSLTSVQSRLREAADFDGTVKYASGTGDATSAAALKEEWTFECVFKPSSIPTGAARAALIDYGSTGGAGANNTLLRVTLAPAVGTTPDVYNVERGNIEVSWEKSTGTGVSNLTTGDFIQQDRWNYLAVVKKYNGFNYDVDVWHCSFGDHVVPIKRASFTGMDNATSGTSSNWFVGTTEALASYFTGEIDDTRVTMRTLSEAEILDSCSRTML